MEQVDELRSRDPCAPPQPDEGTLSAEVPEGPDAAPAVEGRGLGKVYARGAHQVTALREVSFRIGRGEYVTLMGASGCGKSTLLNLIGGIDTASAGQLLLGGREITTLPEAARTAMRRTEIGIVFQFFNLMPTMTVLENVALPGYLARTAAESVEERALMLLAEVGLRHRLDHLPHELSGGELQRASIARALINDPPMLLADEPTGNLDSRNAEHVLEVLTDLRRKYAKTLIVATHSGELGRASDRTIALKDGLIVT